MSELFYDCYAVDIRRAYTGFQFAAYQEHVVFVHHGCRARTSRDGRGADDSPLPFLEETELGVEPVPRCGMSEIAGLRTVEGLEEDVFVHAAQDQCPFGREVDRAGAA